MVKVTSRNLTDIKPYGNNPRKNDQAVDAVAASIKEFGFQQPIVVDQNGVIIVGHTRYKAAKKLGMVEAPCVVAEGLTGEQAKAYRLVDNKTNELAQWDMDALMQELGDISIDMAPFGFADPKEPEEVSEDGYEPVLPEEPSGQVGHVWALGRHRLMCGDATKAEHVHILMDGRVADMFFTDPPYNVDYHGGTDQKLSIMNDKMTAERFLQFLLDAFTNMTAHLKEGGAVYVCHADSEGMNFRRAFQDAGLLLKQCLVWVKNALVLGRQDYHWQHEPILYGWKPGSRHAWCGDRKQSTVIKPEDSVQVERSGEGFVLSMNNGVDAIQIRVPMYEVITRTENSTIWLEDKPKRNAEHPTMKPIRLCGRAIRNSTRQGEMVADYFAGSGSTLMAAEQLERDCFCMELDPRYCDVIIDRWEKYTGNKAQLLQG